MKLSTDKSPTLMTIMFAVVFKPYAAGHWLKNRSLLDAVIAHILSLLLVALIIISFFSYQQIHNGILMKDVLRGSFQIFGSGLIKMSLWRGIIAGVITIISFWALVICMLTSWMAVEMSQLRQLLKGFFLGCFGSVWLLPLSLHLLGILQIIITQNAEYITRYLGITIASLPLTMFICSALTMKMARGYGDALREKIHNEYDRCEFCGYDLRATDFDGRCPECGHWAAESISPIHRINGWEIGQWSFFKTQWQILIHPDIFFRSVTARTLFIPARRFMLQNIVISFLGIYFLAIICAILMPYSKLSISRLLTSMLMFRTVVGSIMWLYAALCLPVLGATLVGNASRRAGCEHSNQMALKICCYLSVFLPMLAMIITLGFVASSQLRHMGHTYDEASEMLRLPMIVSVSLLFAWIWMVGIRGIKWLKWSNR